MRKLILVLCLVLVGCKDNSLYTTDIPKTILKKTYAYLTYVGNCEFVMVSPGGWYDPIKVKITAVSNPGELAGMNDCPDEGIKILNDVPKSSSNH